MAHIHDDLDEERHETLAEKNQKYWNTASTSVFKEKWIQDLQQTIFQHLRSNLHWVGVDETANGGNGKRMLDYACGNGLQSQALSPYFSSCVGMDVSEGMIGKYNEAALERGLSEKQMHAIHGDIMAPAVDPALLTGDLSNFDLVAICMALHHLEDPQEAVKRLVDRVKVGGVFLVIDWATSAERHQEQVQAARTGKGAENGGGGSGHAHQHHHHYHHDHDHGPGRYPAAHTVAHDSFAKEEIEQAFHNAGCDEVDFVLYPTRSEVPMATGGSMQLFFARCRKTA